MPKTEPDKLLTEIAGQPTSAEVRAALLAEGRPVLVAFSGGKDAIATALALQEAGVPIVLAHLYLIPGRAPRRTLDFVEENLEHLEQRLGLPIHRYPHPSLFRWLNALVYQPPERCAVIEAAQLPSITYEQTWDFIREDLELPADTWIADGVRAADSIVRRASLSRHGVMKLSNRKVSPIADWKVAAVREIMARHSIAMPDEYQHFKRSFDGLDSRFLEPMSRAYPADFARVVEWFPLAPFAIARLFIDPLEATDA